MSDSGPAQIPPGLDYSKWLTMRLASLSARHWAAFAGAVAERQLGTYNHFARRDPRLRTEVLRRALDKVWSFAEGASTADALRGVIPELEPLIPDLDRPDAPDDAPLVLSAVATVDYAARCCITGEIRWAVAAACSAKNSVDYRVKCLLYPDCNITKPHEIQEKQQQISQHPLMIREFAHVQREVAVLESIPEIDRAASIRLRALWQNDGKSNIDLK